MIFAVVAMIFQLVHNRRIEKNFQAANLSLVKFRLNVDFRYLFKRIVKRAFVDELKAQSLFVREKIAGDVNFVGAGVIDYVHRNFFRTNFEPIYPLSSVKYFFISSVISIRICGKILRSTGNSFMWSISFTPQKLLYCQEFIYTRHLEHVQNCLRRAD